MVDQQFTLDIWLGAPGSAADWPLARAERSYSYRHVYAGDEAPCGEHDGLYSLLGERLVVRRPRQRRAARPLGRKGAGRISRRHGSIRCQVDPCCDGSCWSRVRQAFGILDYSENEWRESWLVCR